MNLIFGTWLRDRWIPLIILFLLVILTYLNSLGNGFVVDDISAILENPKVAVIQSVTTRPLMFVQPLLYFVASNLFGPNPTMFRLINLLFHIGTVWIIFILLSRTAGRQAAFITATLFAVHPIATESVVWISGGAHVIYSFFILLSLFFYDLPTKEKKYYWFSLVAYLLALASSEKAVIFPGILLIYEIAFLNFKQNWKKLIPFFILSGLLIFSLYLPQVGGRVVEFQKTTNTQPVFNNPLILIPYVITSYLKLIFWPINLSLFHFQTKVGFAEYLIRLVVFFALFGLIGFSYKKNKPIFFWLCFFVVSISWTFIPTGVFWIIAERYVYLGTTGILFFIGYVLAKLLETKKAQSLAVIIYILLIIFFASRTVIRNFDWKNTEALWLATVKSDPSYYKAHYSLGVEYEEQGKLEKALKEYTISLTLNPNDPKTLTNLGSVYLKQKNYSKALEISKRAIKLNSWLWEPYQNIGVVYYLSGSYEKAETYTKKALQRLPKNSDRYIKASSELYFNLGAIYYQKGDKVKAKEYFAKALEFDPKNERTIKLLRDSALWEK